MPLSLAIKFASLTCQPATHAVLLTAEGPELGQVGQRLDGQSSGQLTRAMDIASFTGKSHSAVSLLAPAAEQLRHLIVTGAGAASNNDEQAWATIGGHAAGQLASAKTADAAVIMDCAGLADQHSGDAAAAVAMGALLRTYNFDLYKTRKSASDNPDNGGKPDIKLSTLTIHTGDPEGAERALARTMAIAEGVALARDLVNEPANILGPVEFAIRCETLREVGVDVEIFDAERLDDIGMHALLAVAQGSERPARVAVMQWHGAKSKRTKPLCFIGKGVCFDTGGISMKPAGGMEDMKGDMGGAACVTGLIHTLAARQAGVNAIGIVGLVENMPSGSAQRPGDIVQSLSGQTVEVLNTDAEGRLVLADLLTYAQAEFKPRFMINLATLTGAIIIALGKDHAGMFSNNDRLADDLTNCGLAVGEKVWRMPLGKAYDKLIDTPNADMKNIGGRWGGSITAAQFLQRFVDDTPWAHLDIAGTAMASDKSEISRSWASGWGVRLLDRLVSEKYER